MVSILSTNSSVSKFIYKQVQQTEYLDVKDDVTSSIIINHEEREEAGLLANQVRADLSQ